MDTRFNPEGRKYQIQKLWERQHEILGLALLGAEVNEIAEVLDVTTATVSNCLNSEIGKQQLAIMRGARDAGTIDISREIRNHAPRALQVLTSLLEDGFASEHGRIKVAMDLLDRAGYGAPKFVYGQFAHAHLSSEDIDELKERARKRKILGKEDYVDVEGT